MYLTVEDEEDRWEVMQHLLEKLQPIQNGLESAILVQKNDTVREVVNFLRGALPNVPVMGESVKDSAHSAGSIPASASHISMPRN